MSIYKYACEECRKKYIQAPEKNTCYECEGLVNKISGLDATIKTLMLTEDPKLLKIQTLSVQKSV